MKAVRLYGPSDLRLEEVPKPSAPPGGLLVEVKACAICGSDVRNVASGGSGHGFTLPRTIGHEIAGVIAEVGKSVEGFEVGSRVVLSVSLACGRCRYCLTGKQNLCESKKAISYQYDGGFAEYVAVPEALVRYGGVLPIPDGIDFYEASLTEPFSCALNGQELSKVSTGDTVVIIGAGPVGIMHAILARINGASKIILAELTPERLEKAREIGAADIYVDSSKEDLKEKVLKETNGLGADVVIVAAPSGKAQLQAIDLAAKGGRVNLFGGLPKGQSQITIDSNVIHYRELFVHGTSDSTPVHMKKILDLMGAGRIDARKLISAVLPLENYKEGFELARSGKALKVILTPNGNA
ncbi:MAG: zinc-dependent dehydrogenase [Thermosediminibacteraceae bacterium]|nr:zinc-dependent dehydrogenase [Thermosediminibacteraceae bacterium]